MKIKLINICEVPQNIDQNTLTSSVYIFEMELSDLQCELQARGLDYTGSKLELTLRLAKAVKKLHKIMNEDKIKARYKKVKMCIGLNTKGVILKDSNDSGVSTNVIKTKNLEKKIRKMKNKDKKSLDKIFGCSDTSVRRLLLHKDKNGTVRTFVISRDVSHNDSINKIVVKNDKKRAATSPAFGEEKKLKEDTNKCETPLLSDANKTSTSVSTITDNEAEQENVLNKREENIEKLSESLTKSETEEKLEEQKTCIDFSSNADEKTEQMDDAKNQTK